MTKLKWKQTKIQGIGCIYDAKHPTKDLQLRIVKNGKGTWDLLKAWPSDKKYYPHTLSEKESKKYLVECVNDWIDTGWL